jgi:hypothetical protein
VQGGSRVNWNCFPPGKFRQSTRGYDRVRADQEPGQKIERAAPANRNFLAASQGSNPAQDTELQACHRGESSPALAAVRWDE